MTPVNIFVSYAEEDEIQKNYLLTHLKALKDAQVWERSQIMLGEEPSKVIKYHLDEADIILILLSQFHISKEQMESDLGDFIERANRKQSLLVPIVLNHCYYQDLPIIGKYKVYPKDGIPVNDKRHIDIDEVYVEIIKELQAQINNLKNGKVKLKQSFDEQTKQKGTDTTNSLKKGSIQVITGGMFSGKTIELMRRVSKEKFANRKVKIFKSDKDIRYSKDHIVSHNGDREPSIPISDAKMILDEAAEAAVIGIDEAQFFDKNIIDVCIVLAESRKKVIVAGLDMDYRGYPFGPMPLLMAIADEVTKIHAVCGQCGGQAQFSCLNKNIELIDSNVHIAGKEDYIALCRDCYSRR